MVGGEKRKSVSQIGLNCMEIVDRSTLHKKCELRLYSSDFRRTCVTLSTPRTPFVLPRRRSDHDPMAAHRSRLPGVRMRAAVLGTWK